MKELIEDLISRIEIEKTHSFRVIENSQSNDKTLENIHTGKIFAFDFCSNELRRLLDYQYQSEKIHMRN